MVRTILSIGVVFFCLLAFVRGDEVNVESEKSVKAHVPLIQIKFADPQKGLESTYATLIDVAAKYNNSRMVFSDDDILCRVEKVIFTLHNERKAMKDLLASKNRSLYLQAFDNFTRNTMLSLEAQNDMKSLRNLKYEMQGRFTSFLMKFKATLYGAYKSKMPSISSEDLQGSDLTRTEGETQNEQQNGVDEKPSEDTNRNDQLMTRSRCESSGSEELCKLRERFGIRALKGNVHLQMAEQIFLHNTDVQVVGGCYKANEAKRDRIAKFKGSVDESTVSASLKFSDYNNLRGRSQMTSEWSFTSRDDALMEPGDVSQPFGPSFGCGVGMPNVAPFNNGSINALLSHVQSLFADFFPFKSYDVSKSITQGNESPRDSAVKNLNEESTLSDGAVMPEFTTSEGSFGDNTRKENDGPSL